MFSQPVVFIIGAGASAEYRMPVGAQLKTNIERVVGDSDFLALLKSGGKAQSYEQAGRELAKIIPSFVSIDEALNWFNSRSDIVELGKNAIVRVILREERSSLLFNQSDANSTPDDVTDAWLPHFLSMIMAETKEDEAEAAFQHLTIINFNYDRTVEHYIYSALQRNFGLKEDRAKQIVANLKTLRPYGTVGPLPCQGGEKTIPFGAVSVVNDYKSLVTIARNIRTYTEQQAEAISGSIRSELERSRLVVFLGFGFHQQNMRLLRVGRSEHWKRVFATGMNMEENNHSTIKTAIATTVGTEQPPLLLDWSATSLLVQLRPAIMAAAQM